MHVVYRQLSQYRFLDVGLELRQQVGLSTPQWVPKRDSSPRLRVDDDRSLSHLVVGEVGALSVGEAAAKYATPRPPQRKRQLLSRPQRKHVER
jgi:hypothetical protein